MFSRSLTAPEALRHYADTRTGALQRIAEQLRFARNNNGTDRVYHAKEAAKTGTQCLNLLNFMPAHIPELPTDDATIAVLRPCNEPRGVFTSRLGIVDVTSYQKFTR